MAVFREIQCWIDPIARDGPRAMAVDEWLCVGARGSGVPMLRVYRWAGDWASVGYFGNLEEAQGRIDCPSWVRRMTGGGVVDHRADWTYSLVVPMCEPLASRRGGGVYRLLHSVLAEVLCVEGVACGLSSGMAVAGESLCFANPVDDDVVDAGGKKIAGAGQRRMREGLLHQGSVALACDVEDSARRARALAQRLAERVVFVDMMPPGDVLDALVAVRYGADGWLTRR